ncbi:DNA cytosine methyltransferase [Kitasatospora sp. NBC_01266]|uniref:DNA cytosine methyltransferase n=1 Tax=Kitasatospora sp. NBC_01266 TaxID=2903572 RepID=UPI003FA5E9C9
MIPNIVCGPGALGPQALTRTGSGLRIGSLCTGTAALDLAVEAVLPARLAWCADNDPAARLLLAHRFPHVPNLGDLTAVDWYTVEPVEILTAGFPCQDISYAGRGAGLMEGTRSGLWHTIAHAVRVLAPRYVFVENVTALRRRGLDTVAADLAVSGYDLAWRCLRASDVGAPHRRDRLFLLGLLRDAPAGNPHRLRLHRAGTQPAHRTGLQPAHPNRSHHSPDRRARCPDPGSRPGYWQCATSVAADPAGWRRCQGKPTSARFQGRPHSAIRHRRHCSEELGSSESLTSIHTRWGDYEAAIRRWERILNRPAPQPTCPGRTGTPVLSPDFVEWMIGLSIGIFPHTGDLSCTFVRLAVRDTCRT